ncbi:ATP-binding cassette subfamily F protein uup [Paenibacillus shirakamiensis]|uniref:ATP-binding cassette subfamily F protein uup n=1 Tax=Paenibacillus shirakamiensis TaxID=1265935 RepID=A0ABS4JJM7_9BACL|nr:ABC-F family ATP-binding cassette domain-containing protein [Paenibacillus shirakamiensis]MBP2001316.1 ATP-binding cassette subfamily F protein uup [Paenibacillus shirakamiensis]
MNIMTVEQLSKSYGEKVLFAGASFGMEDQDKVGVVGVNGTGKSTFLKVIAGLETADEGKISVSNDVRIRYLAQNPDYNPDLTILQQVFHGGGEELQTVYDYMQVLTKLEEQPEDQQAQEDASRLGQDMDRLQVWSLESEAKSVLSKLGLTDMSRLMGTLSGGQRKRVALASALIQPSELLILDEPTNHIDNDSVAWLEQYLQKRRGALLMITHDRYFLDRVAKVMIELDHGRLFRYEANYSRFLELKSEREEREASSEHKRQNLLRTELAWIRRGAKARSTKQKARIERFETLQNQKPDQKNGSVDISVASTRLGRKILEISDLEYKVGDRTLIRDLTYTAVPGDRVGIIGPNGSGKSTLLNLIAGRLQPTKGLVDVGQTVKLGYFTQEPQEMKPEQRVIEYIKDEAEIVTTADGSRITAAQMLERFLFDPGMQWTPISKLSGGEKRRLYLLKILMASPNVLMLDEPTNDLDIQTLTVLEAYLDEFPGAVFVVSHDRYFLDRTVDRIMAFESDARISEHVGDYSEYEERKAQLLKNGSLTEMDKSPAVPSSTISPKVTSTGASDKFKEKLKFSFKEQREYDTIDADVEAGELKLTAIAEEMESSASDSGRLQELMREQQKAEEHLEHLMTRWTYLNELAEKIEAQKKA